MLFNALSANPTKWPNTLKQFVGKLPTNCLSVFGHFVKLALKWLKRISFIWNEFHLYYQLKFTSAFSDANVLVLRLLESLFLVLQVHVLLQQTYK